MNRWVAISGVAALILLNAGAWFWFSPHLHEPTTVQWRMLVVSSGVAATAIHGLNECGIKSAYVADEFEKFRRRYKLSEARNKQLDDTFAAYSEDARTIRPQTKEDCSGLPDMVAKIISRMREVQ
jgi:hypothetical protein